MDSRGFHSTLQEIPPMRRIALMVVLVTVVLFTSMSFQASAQDGHPSSLPDTPKYNMYFPGGSLEEYCQVLRDMAGANIVTDQHATSINMPKVVLEGCTVTTLLRIADQQQAAIQVQRLESDAVSFDQSPSKRGPAGGRAGRVEFTAEPEWIYLVTVNASKAFFGSHGNDAESKRRFDLEFEGGTASDYVSAIREAYPKASILAMPGLDAFEIPAANLQGVTVSAALQAINNQRAIIDRAPAEIHLDRAQMPGSDESVFTLSLKKFEHEQASAVWSVGEHLDLGVGEGELLSAVNAVLTLNDQEAVVRFHPETRLIMVRGRQETLEMAEETLEQVMESAWSARKQQTPGARQDEIEDLRARVVELERKLGLRDD